jgi:hypothetical protein
MIKTRTGVHAPARYLMALFAVLAGVLAPAPALLIHAAPQAVPGVDPNFYKLTVSQTGLVRVTYESLQAAGLPVTTLDPATFQLYEQGVEIARQVVDADSSGTFTPGDYVLFYGRAVDTYYTGTNVYWLTYGVAPGLDMATRDGTPQSGLPLVLSLSKQPSPPSWKPCTSSKTPSSRAPCRSLATPITGIGKSLC